MCPVTYQPSLIHHQRVICKTVSQLGGNYIFCYTIQWDITSCTGSPVKSGKNNLKSHKIAVVKVLFPAQQQVNILPNFNSLITF